ncbi:MAG: DUF1232 domain-containing protein [Deltaproteobacteria bacterium]|nr:DUF1232 domain-containing protein [Deltaproteobacteria bacterium]
MWRQWKTRVVQLKHDTFALYLASRDPRVPRAAKIMAAIVLAYAFSPIDLIPDSIPVLGYLDDLLLIPLGIALAIKLIPDDIWCECKTRAAATLSTKLPRSRTAAIAIIAIWLGAAAWLTWIAWKILSAQP